VGGAPTKKIPPYMQKGLGGERKKTGRRGPPRKTPQNELRGKKGKGGGKSDRRKRM